MRLIDADALRKFLHEDDFDTPDERWKPESEFAKMIDALPTVDIKTEVAKEILNEIANDVSSKIPMTICPIYKNDLDFDAGLKNGKADALIEVLKLIAKLENKYTKGE